MKISQFQDLLQTHRDKQFRLVLPSQNAVPISFHITEIAHVQKRFIDCGGRPHTTHTCQMQAWVWTDFDHRLSTGKMADILVLAQKILPEGQDLDIEIEYEEQSISQYPVASYAVTEDAVLFNLTTKHTDCLAKDICLPMVTSNCGPECGCS